MKLNCSQPMSFLDLMCTMCVEYGGYIAYNLSGRVAIELQLLHFMDNLEWRPYYQKGYARLSVEH